VFLFFGGKYTVAAVVDSVHHTRMPNAGDVTIFIASIPHFIGRTM
jgi:hypothetical protein